MCSLLYSLSVPLSLSSYSTLLCFPIGIPYIEFILLFNCSRHIASRLSPFLNQYICNPKLYLFPTILLFPVIIVHIYCSTLLFPNIIAFPFYMLPSSSMFPRTRITQVFVPRDLSTIHGLYTTTTVQLLHHLIRFVFKSLYIWPDSQILPTLKHYL